MNDLMELLQNVGFPILSVMVLGWYLMQAHKTLLDAHTNLIKDIDKKIDKLLDKE